MPDPALFLPRPPPDRPVPAPGEAVDLAPTPGPTAAGAMALAAAQALARKAAAPATLRAYKADWTHYAAWCAQAGFVPVPAAPATVGAYLASLAESHAPTTVRRRLSAIGKMHRTLLQSEFQQRAHGCKMLASNDWLPIGRLPQVGVPVRGKQAN